MSTKKDKILESAQKFIVKGQIDRAIKEYEQVVALDPSDIRHRQRLAELLVRVNRKDEAIGEYEAIGKYYSDNGYYLKAIAVYKQIQKLDPGNIKISLNLATLNEKQGLTGNALAEYSLVYSYYEKSGRQNDALSTLESMIAIDPDNLNTRLKFAETRFSAGSREKAYEDFIDLAVTLKKRGDGGAHKQVCERMQHLFPEKKETLALELLAAQLKVGDADSALPGLRELTKTTPGNIAAWELLIEALRAAGEVADLKSVFQKMADLFPAELLPKERLIDALLEEGDTDGTIGMLLTERASFLEQKAYARLERIYCKLFEKLPQDEKVLRGLAELYEITGEEEKLAEVMEKLKLPEVAAEQENEPFGEAQTALLPESAPEDGGSAVVPDAPLAIEPASMEEVLHASQSAPLFQDDGQQDEEEAVDFELDLSDDEMVELARLYEGVDVYSVSNGVPAATRLQIEPEENQVTEPAYPSGEEDPPFQDAITDTDLELELADSDFYDSEEGDLTEDQLSDLNHAPLAGMKDDAPTGFADNTLTGDEALADLGDEALTDLSDDALTDLGDDALADLGDDALTDLSDDALTDLGDDALTDLGDDELTDSGNVPSDLRDYAFSGLNEDAFSDLSEDAFSRLTDAALSEEHFNPPLQTGTFEIDFNALSASDPASGRMDTLSSTVRKGEYLDDEDTETHYNLGIAFKEMGLYDDAIKEFEVAARDPARMVDCLILQGTCCREKGDIERSLEILKKGFDLRGLLPDQLSPIKYELAIAYEATGQKEQALSLFKEIAAVDRGFRDTGKRIADLQGVEIHEHYELDLIELDRELE